jgi:diguanylate cyclase (GGDEF)-like protein
MRLSAGSLRHRWRRVLLQPMVGFTIALLSLIWFGLWHHLETERQALRREVASDTFNLALAFGENVARTASEIDNLLKFMRRSYERGGFKDEWQSLVKDEYTVNEQTVQIGVIDAKGLMITSSAMLHSTQPLDFSDREHFRVHRQSQEDALFISKPLIGRASGKWSIQFTRPFWGADGQFAGVLVVSLDPSHLSRVYRDLNLGEGSGLALLGTDKVIRAGAGIYEGSLGEELAQSAQNGLTQHVGAGTDAIQADVEGRPGKTAYRRVRGYPLAVVVTGRDWQRDAAWLARQRGYIVVAILASGLSIAAAFLALRHRRLHEVELERQHHVVEQQKRELSRRNLQFDAALNNMSQGVCFFDGAQCLIVCNKRYVEMYGLDPQRVRAGTSLREIIDLRCEAGSGPNKMSADDYHAWRNRVATFDRPSDTVIELMNGRIVEIHHQPMPDGGWVATHRDITESRRAEARIAHMARHDALTGLPNRVQLSERIEQALARVEVGELVAVHLLDLDHFKSVNDTLGHLIGDKLLQIAADRLRSLVRGADTIARMGGDEFAIVQLALSDSSEATALAERVVACISEPYELDGQPAVIGVSVGIALAQRTGLTSDQLIRNADLALYCAKDHGRCTVRLFEPAMDVQVQKRHRLEQDLRRGLAQHQFELRYQPVVDVAANKITAFEALLRWRHPERGLIGPAEFIPLAEEIGLIAPLGAWVLVEACKAAARWRLPLKIAVNLSPIQFRTSGLVQVISAALALSGLPPERLELEITEAALLEEGEDTMRILYELRELGVRIAMDDFGTGYSSLNYLQSFPFDRIKIDRSFVNDITRSTISLNIVRAVIALAKGLGMSVTAEGVEAPQQSSTLAAEGCTEMQGNLFSEPVHFARIEHLLNYKGLWLDRGQTAA